MDFEALTDTVALRGKTVVDIGCGDGALVRRMITAGANAIGVDVTVDRARAVDPAGRYLMGGAENIPLPDASVDVAVLMRSLHHVPNPHDAFPELKRVVRGEVYIAEPLATGEYFELMRPVDDETEVRAKAQEAITHAQGFERVKTFDYDVVLALEHFETFRDRVLYADASRADQFAALEPQLRERFRPGEYTIHMRADLLRASSVG
jgi:ubiquinone/menaquinone biosynthesis C-methylase UbiE